MPAAETPCLILGRDEDSDAPVLLAQLNEPSFHRHIDDRAVSLRKNSCYR
jgi:hypothetical protein